MEQAVYHDNGTVTIKQSRYDDMKERLAWLECLEAAGVDNWQGIDEAFNMMDGDEDG